jgi:hypothetical protein
MNLYVRLFHHLAGVSRNLYQNTAEYYRMCPSWGNGILQACGAWDVGSIPTLGLVILI